MKFLIAVLSFSAVSAFATEYKCTSSQTGKTYELSAKYGEITIYDSRGREEGSLDGLRVEEKSFDSRPPRDIVTFIDAEDESVVAQLGTMLGKTVGSYRDDKKLVCTSKK